MDILTVKKKLILVVKEMLKDFNKAQVRVSIDPPKIPKTQYIKNIYTSYPHHTHIHIHKYPIPKYAQQKHLNVHSKPRYGENPLSPIRFLPYIAILLGCGLIAKLGTKTRPNSEVQTRYPGHTPTP